jgi:hypothetical protein
MRDTERLDALFTQSLSEGGAVAGKNAPPQGF